MQERLAAVYYQRILPELDKVFGEFEEASPGGLTIPTVSIDCGILGEADWEEALAASVFSQIREELQRYGHLRGEPGFIHFLQTGRYQWDSLREAPADYESQLILNGVFLDELTAALRTADDVLKRLFHYCTPDFMVRLADALVADRIPQACVAYISLLRHAGVEPAVRSRAVVSAYCAIHRRPSVPMPSFNIALTDSIWPFIDAAQRAEIVDLIAQSPPADPDFIAALLPLIASEFPDRAGEIGQQVKAKQHEQRHVQAKETKDPAGETTSPTEETTAEPKTIAQKAVERKTREQIHTDRVADTYYITNAGLVLAYPFIAPLLQRTGLMDDKQQFFPDANGHAAALLQHLAYESPIMEENDLPLNKLLTGLQPTAFVDPALFGYTPLMQRECEDVLHAVITHWSVLRNTSVAGIRETFFQRDGKLTPRTDGWLLQVDSRGVDVLLASLPWSIGIIKLPWMDSMLYVEWA